MYDFGASLDSQTVTQMYRDAGSQLHRDLERRRLVEAARRAHPSSGLLARFRRPTRPVVTGVPDPAPSAA